MKILITYYYHIRNLSPNQIPVATTLSVPPWFRKEGQAYVDKRGVVNGLRCQAFVPGRQLNGLCKGKDNIEICGGDPTNCTFLKGYREQLDGNDVNSVLDTFEKICCAAEDIKGEKIENPEIVLIVYESFEKNKCSEAQSIIDYFKDNGIDIEIFHFDAAADRLAAEKAKYDF